jgi:hypothetical protein
MIRPRSIKLRRENFALRPNFPERRHQMPSRSEPTPTDYADVFVAAIEGGINYWALIEGYEFAFADRNAGDPGLDYARAQISEREGDHMIKHDSRSDVWHTAVDLAAKEYGLTATRFIEEHDAEYADVAVQFAMFGEVVYS